MNLCVRCGNIKFNSYETYQDHMKLYHDLRVKHIALNVSGRTKAQIVEDVEQNFRIIWYQAGYANPLMGYGEEITW